MTTSISTPLPVPLLSDLAGVAAWQVQVGADDVTDRDPMLLMGRSTIYCLTGIDGFGVPGMSTSDVSFPYADGVAALGDFHEPRDITLSGAINPGAFCSGSAAKAAACWEAMHALNGAWQARQFDTLLRFRWVTGQTYVCFGRPRACSIDQSGLYRGFVGFTARFLATEPRLFSNVVASRESALQDVSATVGMCMDPPGPGTCVIFDPTGACFGGLPKNGTVEAANQGNTTTPPIISITGPVTGDATVENMTTGESFAIAGPIAGGDTIVVDTGRRTIKLGTANRFNLLRPGGSLFWLVPGVNVVRLRTGNNTSGTIKVEYRDAWI